MRDDGDVENSPEDAPVLHLNGSSGDVLAAGYRAALEKLYEAHELVQATAPHGRDYYVKGDPDALTKATQAHHSRLGAIEKVESELKALYFDVRSQQDQQAKQKRS